MASQMSSGSFINEGLEELLLERVCYPDGDLKGYLEERDRFGLPDLPLILESDRASSNQMAWQGVIYLPENIVTDEEDASRLIFKAEGEELQSAYTVSLSNKITDNTYGLKRGKMYDIVARLVNPATLSPSGSVYRLYWPQSLGTVLTLTLPDGQEITVDPSSEGVKKLGDIKNQNNKYPGDDYYFYFYEFTTPEQEGEINYSIKGKDNETIGNGNLNDFQESYNRNYEFMVAYIPEIDSENLNPGYPFEIDYECYININVTESITYNYSSVQAIINNSESWFGNINNKKGSPFVSYEGETASLIGIRFATNNNGKNPTGIYYFTKGDVLDITYNIYEKCHEYDIFLDEL